MSNLKLKITSLPKKPGVYIYKNESGEIIYIGKAKNLSSRVKQYFQGNDERPQIPFLLKELFELDYTVVENELESLYLERTLIQKYLPKYNILLRDDKNFCFIKIDYSTEIPQIQIVRKLEENKSSQPPGDYFGPYSAAYKARELLKTVRYIFPYCSNIKISNKPCFYYHLHRCPGVCVGVISPEEYKLHLERIQLFLKGDIKTVKTNIEKDMKIAAGKKLFEKAARLRNQLRGLVMIEQKQNVILPKKVSWDIIGFYALGQNTCINLFKVRAGKLIDKENFIYSINNVKEQAGQHKQEILEKFLEDYYLEASDRPDKIYLYKQPENKDLIEKLLVKRFHKKTFVMRATQKEPLKLLNLSTQNAEEFLKQTIGQTAAERDRINLGLTQLKDVLKLQNFPKRIECYDISNIQGTNAVGSMVVFIEGKPAKSQYRKFKIRGKNTPDDFSMLKEMLDRRIARSQNSQPQNRSKWDLPDLIVIDGGKGQLSAAVEILTTYNLQLTTPIIGLAKRIEEIFLPSNPSPIVLNHDQPALQLLQRLRDETHRFGITFHRNLRSKQAIKSALDEIPGVGPKTKKLLKQNFGTAASVKRASLEELANVVGKKLAQNLKQKL